MVINKLDEIRRAKGLTRNEIASHIGVHPHTIANWEKNPEAIPIGKAKELCDLFGIEWNINIF